MYRLLLTSVRKKIPDTILQPTFEDSNTGIMIVAKYWGVEYQTLFCNLLQRLGVPWLILLPPIRVQNIGPSLAAYNLDAWIWELPRLRIPETILQGDSETQYTGRFLAAIYHLWYYKTYFSAYHKALEYRTYTGCLPHQLRLQNILLLHTKMFNNSPPGRAAYRKAFQYRINSCCQSLVITRTVLLLLPNIKPLNTRHILNASHFTSKYWLTHASSYHGSEFRG